MTDITTIEEVDAEDYTVRVGQTDDGQNYEAVVIGESGSSPSPSHGLSGIMVTMGSNTSDDSDGDSIGPAVTAPHRWVAIGFAIEAYQWRQLNEDTEDVEDAYATFADETDLSGLGIGGDAIAGPLEDFSISFDANGGGGSNGQGEQ